MNSDAIKVATQSVSAQTALHDGAWIGSDTRAVGADVPDAFVAMTASRWCR